MQSREERRDLGEDIVRQHEYIARNISSGGALLATTKAVKVGQVLLLDFDFSGTLMQIKCIVRWCRQTNPIFESEMACGVEFDGLLASQIVAIRKYLKEIDSA